MTNSTVRNPDTPSSRFPRLFAFCLAVCAPGTALAQDAEKAPLPPPAEAPSQINPGSGWLLDLQRAKAAAKESGKDILINFSGSDWCPPCIVLEERIFSKESFIQEFSQDFLLVNLDFPRNREKQSKALQTAVDQAVHDYAISAYPTIVLADSLGRPYARTGYKQMDAEEYGEHLRSLTQKRVERDAHFHAAKHATGSERARYLGKALEPLPPSDILAFYRPQYREAVSLDPEHAGGLAHVIFFEKKSALENELDRYAKDKNWYAVLARIERFAREETLTPAQRQEIEFFKAGSLFHLADFEALENVLHTIVELDPESEVAQKSKQFLNAVNDLRKKAETGDKPVEPRASRPGETKPPRPGPRPAPSPKQADKSPDTAQ